MDNNVKVCLKCKHKTSYEGEVPIACEACGAVYSKVEAAMMMKARSPASSSVPNPPTFQAAAATPATPTSAPSATIIPLQIDTSVAEFTEIMRAESLYPTWRELVKWCTWFGYAIAAFLLVAGVFGVLKGSPGAGGGLVAGALIVAILARVWRELSLMIADLADAAVRTAASKN
jgi:hypothetical protein